LKVNIRKMFIYIKRYHYPIIYNNIIIKFELYNNSNINSNYLSSYIPNLLKSFSIMVNLKISIKKSKSKKKLILYNMIKNWDKKRIIIM
jgi:hypothetical protein